MSNVISIIGGSGLGKTTSFRNIAGDESVIIFRTSKKPFSFRNKLKEWNSDSKTGDYVMATDYEFITAALGVMANTYGKKVLIIEDSTFLMTDFFMSTAKQTGFEKFTNNGLGYYNLIKAAENLPDDVTVYMVNHIDEDANGFKKVKTIGKMLDEKVDIVSLLTIVLEAKFMGKQYVLETNKSNERDLSKSPMGMFEDKRVPNDLALVDNAIREYYYMDKLFKEEPKP